MNEEKQNKTYYKETFYEVHAPKALAERVKNMSELKSKKKTGVIAKGVAVAAMAAVVLFAGTNGVAYATTGSTWIETLVDTIKLYGVEYDVALEERQKTNGEIWYEGSVEAENGDVATVTYEQIGDTFYAVGVSTEFSHSLQVKDGRAYVTDIDTKIDVTDEVLENGQVTGTYEVNGYTKEYRVWMEGEYYHYEITTLYDGMEEDVWANTQNTVEIFVTPTQTPEP